MQRSRSITLDLLRGLSCLMVVIYHLNTNHPVGMGQAAMEMFFVLSGYLISSSLVAHVERRGLAGVTIFAGRRIRRLVPGMVGFLIGALILNLLFASVDWRDLGVAALNSLFGTYNFYQVFGHPRLVEFGGIWSLSLEEQFYFLALVVVTIAWIHNWSASSIYLILAVSLITVGMCSRIFTALGLYISNDTSFMSYLPPLRMLGFGLGVAAVWVQKRCSMQIHRLGGAIAIYVSIICVSMGTILILTVESYGPRAFLLQWSAVPLLVAFIVVLAPLLDKQVNAAMDGSCGPRRWQMPLYGAVSILRLIGLASYSIYLWHCLVISFVVREGHPRTHTVWISMAVASVGLGIAAWWLIERRFYKFTGFRFS